MSEETPSAKALGLATHVHRLLREYIVVHDLILGHSFRKVIPIPGFFKPIDFGDHKGRLHWIAHELDGVRQEVPAMKAAVPAHGKFLDLLDEYAASLARTVRRLEGVSAKLYQKGQGNRSYAWAEYKRDLSEYEASVSLYKVLGEKVNELLPTIRG